MAAYELVVELALCRGLPSTREEGPDLCGEWVTVYRGIVWNEEGRYRVHYLAVARCVHYLLL